MKTEWPNILIHNLHTLHIMLYKVLITKVLSTKRKSPKEVRGRSNGIDDLCEMFKLLCVLHGMTKYYWTNRITKELWSH